MSSVALAGHIPSAAALRQRSENRTAWLLAAPRVGWSRGRQGANHEEWRPARGLEPQKMSMCLHNIPPLASMPVHGASCGAGSGSERVHVSEGRFVLPRSQLFSEAHSQQWSRQS